MFPIATQRRVALVFTAITCAAAMPAAAQVRVDPAKSEIVFVSKQMGVPVEGRFRKFDAQVAFDPRKPDAGRIGLSIDTGSATLGVPEVDGELPKPAWFGAVRFPQASFQSSAIKGLGGGRYDVSGKLTIKGNSQDVVVPVTLVQAGTAGTATGSFAIRRLDFRIGDGEWADTSMVANDVQVRFKLQLSGLAAP